MDPNADDDAEGSPDENDPGQETRYSEADVQKIKDDLKQEFSQTMQARINENNARHEKKEPAPQREFSRAELNQLIRDEKITEEQGQGIYDNQLERKIDQKVQDGVATSENNRSIDATIDKYKAFDPDLVVPGSKSRLRIEGEVQIQMSMYGQKEATLNTELAALRTIYGDADNLTSTQEKDRESHQDTTSGSDKETVVNKDGWPKGLSAKERTYYDGQVGSGRMTVEDVVEEMKFANQGIRDRAKARA